MSSHKWRCKKTVLLKIFFLSSLVYIICTNTGKKIFASFCFFFFFCLIIGLRYKVNKWFTMRISATNFYSHLQLYLTLKIGQAPVAYPFFTFPILFPLLFIFHLPSSRSSSTPIFVFTAFLKTFLCSTLSIMNSWDEQMEWVDMRQTDLQLHK